jgi:3-methyladenine DNA glycosylase/8-oxoguanine DNA glycosylase
MMGQHAKFIARTVLVQNNDIEQACRIINRFVLLFSVKNNALKDDNLSHLLETG